MVSEVAPRALVVDDNFYNRDLCTLALRHIGYEVEEAEDGVEAMKTLNLHTFDLVVLDLFMPKMDGFAVIRELSTQATFKNLCIIVMTANPHMTIHEEIYSRADYVMQKPIDIQLFGKLLERLKAAGANRVPQLRVDADLGG